MTALRGQPLSRYVEESLERSLKEDEGLASSAGSWIDGLPAISDQAAKDPRRVLEREDFRPIDKEMWK